ncbi:MAG TPA: hypothetical protein VK577_03115 [Bradyrhizobium sp.]|nr:hypothetical protein [Bradyrhizobium sp.]
MTQTERAPLDIDSYSKAYLEGKLDKVEVAELREMLAPENWRELVGQRYQLLQQAKLNAIKAKSREQIDLSDVVALLVMLLEKP